MFNESNSNSNTTINESNPNSNTTNKGHQINNLTCNSCTFLKFSWFVIIIKNSYNLFNFFVGNW